jgi:hypothetical protein
MALGTADELALRNPCGQSGKPLQLVEWRKAGGLMRKCGLRGDFQRSESANVGYRRDGALWDGSSRLLLQEW